MAGRDPPPFLNTPEDRGAIVAVVSFTFVVVSTLTNGIRVWIRQQAKTALGVDDGLLVGANVSESKESTPRRAADYMVLAGHSHHSDCSGWRKCQAWSWAPF